VIYLVIYIGYSIFCLRGAVCSPTVVPDRYSVTGCGDGVHNEEGKIKISFTPSHHSRKLSPPWVPFDSAESASTASFLYIGCDAP
jgi:hypothetical protein